MDRCYCVFPALQTAVAEVLESYGLEPDAAAASRKTPPAATLEDQIERIAVCRLVVAAVDRIVPVGEDDRRLIRRLVDSAQHRIEKASYSPRTTGCEGATTAGLVAYVAAGGGGFGTFAEFRQLWTSDQDLLEPAVDRQDISPAPLSNPSRRPDRPNQPRTTSPAKANPTRTIRSSRWSGKAVRR